MLFTAVALFCAISSAFAQKMTVRGTVTETSGDPVAGAAVQLKGNASTYAVTDVSGNYQISVPADGVLVFNCMGYRTFEAAVSGRGVVDVTLTVDSELLEDVIVVGYGTTRREATTGAVSTMKSDNLAEVPAASVDKMLAGKMAGVTITSETGQPGGNSQIRIRGTSSVNAGNEPLWVVDGIPVMSGNQAEFTNTNNAIAAINPNDIESITILKDAAAASIYGSRAANGVILVTTKTGKAGKAQFTARAKFGASQLANDNHFGVMTGQQLLDYQRVCAVNGGFNPDDPTSPYYLPYNLVTGELTNWLKEVTKVGALQEYEVSAMGGNDKSKFYTSLSFQNNDGIAYAVNYRRLTGRVNADYKLAKGLEVGARVNLAYTENHDTEMQNLYYSNPLFAGLLIRPWIPLKDENGEYNLNIPENSNTNPLYTALCHGEDQWEKQYKIQASEYLQWTPVKNLVLKTNNMFEGTFGQGRRYWGPDPGDTEGTLQGTFNQYIQLTTSNTAQYSLDLNNNSFRFLVGQEAMKRTYQYMFGYAPGVDANIPYFSTSVADSSELEDGYSARTLLSFFGNIDYNYDQRYFASASIREDGSSLFGADNKWGTFWSLSGSWNISNEDFMAPTAAWLNLLKVRASYGVNGNNNIAPYQAYGLYSSAAYNGGNGMLPASPANDVLSWEKNKTWNLGVDFAFLNNRISGQIDVYNRKTVDMLLDKKVPATSGFTSNFMNIGAMSNRGFEFMIEGDIIRNADLAWTAGFNIALNRSRVDDLGDVTWMSSDYDSRLRHVVGQPFYTFYLKDYAGVDPSTGAALWHVNEYAKDEDGNDILSEVVSSKLTTDFNKASYIYAGSPEAKATGGFNTTVAWKGLSLSAFFEYKVGNYVYIGETRYLMSDGNQMTMNQLTSALDYWQKPGDTGCNPKPVAGNASNSYNINSTRWLQRGDYLRVKDITLSYTLPETVVSKINVKNAKVYVSALNPYTFHDVNWWDPERGEEGMGFGIYPQTKTFCGGIEITF